MKSQDKHIENIDFTAFHHTMSGRVKTFEVDRQNIVHNIIYLYWLEDARVEYFRALGLPRQRLIILLLHSLTNNMKY